MSNQSHCRPGRRRDRSGGHYRPHRVRRSRLKAEARAFIRANTATRAPPLCPEIELHLASGMTAIWEASEETLATTGLPPPFWAMAWVGGQALARYVLDHPSTVAGKRVLDFGAGSGLCAIAAAKAGAAGVDASDLDAFAIAAIDINAALNGVTVRTIENDLTGAAGPGWDVVLAADLWYERLLAERLNPWLRGLAANGGEVLLGDMRRAHFPNRALQELARYQIPTSVELEREKITTGRVWRMLASNGA